ncbi:MAG: PEP-CTERM sorting domain-containing protein, partial [Bryobacteraceae bacterium]
MIPFARTGNGLQPGTNWRHRDASQTFSTAAGTPYRITFYLANDIVEPNSSFTASFNGVTQFSTNAATIFGYTMVQFTTAPAAGTTSTLTFSFRHDQDFFRLDDVSVLAVPEPSSTALMMLSAAGVLGFVQYRRAG